jgi:hypothetical protein
MSISKNKCCYLSICLHLLKHAVQWNSMFVTLSLIVDGATEKVLQFTMPYKSIYNKDFCFNEDKCIFEHCKKVKTVNCPSKFALFTFQWCPL